MPSIINQLPSTLNQLESAFDRFAPVANWVANLNQERQTTERAWDDNRNDSFPDPKTHKELTTPGNSLQSDDRILLPDCVSLFYFVFISYSKTFRTFFKVKN